MKHHLRLNFPLLRHDPVRVRLRLVLQQQQQDEQVEERRGHLLLLLLPPPGPAAALPCKISHRLPALFHDCYRTTFLTALLLLMTVPGVL